MNVLLIDDEPLALDFLEVQLHKVNDQLQIDKFTVFDVNKEKELLAAADLLFLDIEMPQVNGLELAERVAEHFPDLPIVFVTAYNEYAVHAFEMNALDYVLKPVQVDRLQKTMERIPVRKVPYYTNQLLKVRVCLEFQIEVAAGQFMPVSWRTTKAQEIFLYLLHYRGETVQKTRLIELFWEGIDLEKAYTQLYTTIYYIRKNMAAYSNHFELKNVQNGYLLVTSNVRIDLEEWERRVLTAPPISESTIGQHEELMTLYKGGYLESNAYHWAESERFRLEALWIEHAKRMAIHYDQAHQSESATEWLRMVTQRRAEEEQAHFILMQIYADLGLGLLVHDQYKQLTAALSDIGIQVPASINSWYEHWKKERAGNTPT